MPDRHVSPKKSTTGRAKLIRPVFGTLSRVAPRLAVPVAAHLFRTPHRSRQPARERGWATGAQQLEVATPRGPATALVWGAGPRSVLLQHGWAGRGLQLGGFVAPLVEQGLRVVAYDAPAHGDSPGSASSLPELTEVVSAVAGELGPFDAIVAHSIGGTATLLAVARGWLETGQVVVLAPAADMRAVIERFGQLTGFTPPVLSRMQQLFETRLGFRWQQIEPLAHCSKVTIPVLVVHDFDDHEIPWQEGVELTRAMPHSELLLTHGLGHRRLLRDPTVIKRVTTQLLTGQPSRRVMTAA